MTVFKEVKSGIKIAIWKEGKNLSTFNLGFHMKNIQENKSITKADLFLRVRKANFY